MELISREAAIEAITNYAKFLWDNFHETCPLAGMIDAIEALPTAEKVGKWETEIRTILGAKIPFYACSACGRNSADEYRYCPNCGTRMEGEEDG